MSAELGISRRRFLQLGAGGAVGVAVVGLGVWRWTRSGGADRWSFLFGDGVEEVREVGRRTVAAGVVSTSAEALDLLPSDGIERRDGDGGAGVEITEPSAFAASVDLLVARELDAGAFVTLEDFLFAPAELALAALVFLQP